MFEIITNHLGLWGDALVGTLILFIGGGLLALVLGFIVGAMRVSPVPIARAVGTAYVNLIRNTPLTLVFFVFAFVVPLVFPIGQTDYIVLGVFALGIYTATYVAEVLRSGINTVPVGQAEAARAIGLPFTQVMGLIVLPQAARAVIPPMMSVFIALLKNTTVAAGFSVLNLGSIRANMSELGENAMLVLIWVAIVFVALVMLLSWGQTALERRWKVAR
ncbi:ABC transporter permease subunit [Pseudoclavibacter chungangensis]|uniref:ABC transporter permease subunit n=1 Tax=Pseudoclavibacter chungangensis TaxID=587635 RepID=A0A7J5BN26_9MICO|nr:ABC transporter permease subunit [Pseudoclavibacter chungangensis]KAB1653119.1 ABC transporter permease subunit [Pseudoclavibacter chungangensis]NYJ66992.1 glutamate transport system permease protein [Pseudoclavibacter chungangensis]